MSSRVIVRTYYDSEEMCEMVDFGIDEETMDTVTLPNESFLRFRQHCYYDNLIEEWLLRD